MAIKPILFSAPMVQAILREIEAPGSGKTMTRRVLTAACDEPPAFVQDGTITALDERGSPYRWPRTHAIGDVLWVREAWRTDVAYDTVSPSELAADSMVKYEAGGENQHWRHPWLAYYPGKLRPSMFMPRWASRLTLRVDGVELARLQDINRGECLEEGCPFANIQGEPNPRDWFRDLWNEINGANAWEANPWVAAYTFQPILGNVDEVAHG